MSNLIAERLAKRAKTLLDKLDAMDADGAVDSLVAGSVPNASGAILSRDHQGFRKLVIDELEMINTRLAKMGYKLDTSSNLVPIATVNVTHGYLT